VNYNKILIRFRIVPGFNGIAFPKVLLKLIHQSLRGNR